MGVYIPARQGIWPDHNGMRAPILIDSEGYPYGYPRSDYHKMNIVHDGGDFFIVYLEGTEEFENVYYNIEPLASRSFEELLINCINYVSENSDLRSEIGQKILDSVAPVVSEADILATPISEEVESEIKATAFNTNFELSIPSPQEIEENNLLP